MAAVKNGTAKRGTAAELIADIFDDETDQPNNPAAKPTQGPID